MVGLAAMKAIFVIERDTCSSTGRRFLADRRGLAAVEFAFIVPLVLVLFFGTIELSQGIAVDRKVSLTASTLSTVTSQTPVTTANVPTIADADLQGIFTASISIMAPYSPTPTKAQISEVYIDSSYKATVQWSKAATIGAGATQATLATSTHNAGDDVTPIIPSQLLIKQTYLLISEVSYKYVPTIGYVMAPTGVNLADVSYGRPRLGRCIQYNNVPALQNNDCPTP
jgi:Flp pilus assembly protein TadG